MEYIKAIVQGTDKPKVQEILSGLNSYEDYLLLSGQPGAGSSLKVSYITDHGDAVTLGRLPEDITDKLKPSQGDVWADIADFGVYKRDDGLYKLWVELQVTEDKKSDGCEIIKGLIAVVTLAVSCVLLAVSVIELIDCIGRIINGEDNE